MKKEQIIKIQERRLLFFILSIFLMIILPGFVYIGTSGKTLFSPGSLLFYVLFVIEFIFYQQFLTRRCKPGNTFMVISLSFLFMFIRFITVFSSFLLIGPHIGAEDIVILYKMWYAQPLIPIIQIFIFYTILPDILVTLEPHLLKEEYLKEVKQFDIPDEELLDIKDKTEVKEESDDVFSQILSLNALALCFGKFPYLEGLIISSGEGTILWKEAPNYIHAEMISGRFNQIIKESLRADHILHGSGITKIIIETNRNTTLCVPLTRDFIVIFIFTKKISLNEIENKIKNFSLVLNEFIEREYK